MTRPHRHHLPITRTAAPAFAVVLSLLPTTSHAGTFDPQGVFAFDPEAAFTQGFETFASQEGVEVRNDGALEGDRYVRVRDLEDGTAPSFLLPVSDVQASYRVHAFVRSDKSWYPTIRVTYDGTPGVPQAYATLSPTGKMTSDGWIEIASPSLSIDGQRSPAVELWMGGSSVDLDGVELLRTASEYVPNAPCAGFGQSTCNQGQVCVHGFCHDGASLVPPLPGTSARALYVDVLAAKLTMLFGGVSTRQATLPGAIAAIGELADAQDAWTFWNGIARAINLLRDSHTRVYGLPNSLARGGRAFPVCLVEGDADLSHDLVPAEPPWADVLVSHVGPEKSCGLAPGDRIVSVDGQHPMDWVQGLLGHTWRFNQATDPHVVSRLVEQLNQLIPAYATFIEVIRCDAASGTCTGPDTVEATTFDQDTEDTVWPACDHRPAYHLAEGNPDAVTHELQGVHYGLLADSLPGEDLYGMIWNDTKWYDGASPWEPAFTLFRQQAKGLILDHRTGNGGSPEGAAYLTGLSRQSQLVSVWSLNTTLGLFDAPFGAEDGMALVDLWQYQPKRSVRAGSSSPREDMRIAVLLARNVSGSDFFPFGVKGSPNTRLFGRKTLGAFSMYIAFETPSQMWWTVGSGDFISTDGLPQIGSGVEPDEELVPRQSDLIEGKDTVYERALAWVRCGDEGCP